MYNGLRKSMCLANFVLANSMPNQMKHYFISIIFAILACAGLGAQAQQTDTLFPYPSAPEDKPTLTEKCNYLVFNFWDRCNIKQSFSSLAKLNSAFGTWAAFMPYATADTVHLAIDNYIQRVEKEAPKNILEVGKMAQNWFYCDTAQYYSEELYLPFCHAVAASKKVPNADKAVYAAQEKILESSGEGKTVPNFKFIKPDGTYDNFDDHRASRIILFFNDPDCLDCTLTKARLSADFNTQQLMKAGLVKIVSIYPDEATEEWKKEAAAYPTDWIVGAWPNADEYFDLTDMPTIYWLDGRHKVIGKNIDIDRLLFLVQQIQLRQTQSN